MHCSIYRILTLETYQYAVLELSNTDFLDSEFGAKTCEGMRDMETSGSV